MSEEEFWQQHLLTCAQEAKTDRLPCIDPDTQRLNSKYASLVNQRSRQRKRLAHTKVLYGHVIPELESIDRAAKAISQLADADEKARRTLQLEVRTRNAYVWGEMLPYPFHGDISRWLDEHCASKGKPPVLYRNRRPYEPLKMHVDEFHPNNETECRPGLVEFELEPRLPLQLENDVEHRQIFERLTRIMNDRGGTLTLKKALGPFVGAYEWLVPRCPSLTDPARGGQWSIDRLSTRCLSMEMMLELTHAWVEWPFKPDRSTLLR